MSRRQKIETGSDHVGAVGFGPALVALKFQKTLAQIGALGATLLFFVVFSDIQFSSKVTQLQNVHGLTATCLLLMGIAMMGRRGFRKATHVRDGIFALISLLCALRLAEAVWPSIQVSNSLEEVLRLTPQPHVLMGGDTALSLFLINFGALMRHRVPTLSIVTILAGLVLPSISALGYSYSHQGYYGQMSLATTLIVMALGGAELLLFVRSALLRPFLTTSSWGRMARLQLLFVVGGTWLIGIVIDRSGYEGGVEAVVGGVIWLFLVTMLVTGPLFERVDRDRRALERELKRKANFDPLTGLWNRRAVRDMQMFNIADNSEHRVSVTEHVGVILADVDMFKRINDISGHDEGDRVLRDISRVLRERVRGLDVVARWGGEEFLVLLPDVSVEKTMEIAQILRVAVATSVSWPNKGQNEPVTLSIGVTAMNEQAGKTLELALQDADHALYAAKSLGRNRVMLYGNIPNVPSKETITEFVSNRSIH